MRRGAGWLLVAALLLLWEASARLGWVVSPNWPPLSAVLAAGWQDLASGELALRLAGTLWRAAVGLGIGSAAGIAAGLAMALSRAVALSLGPLVELLRPVPVPAIIPPLILLLGVDDAMKLAIIALSAFFPVAISTHQGAASVDPTLVASARTLGVPGWRIMLAITWPATLPFILAGMRVSLALALVVGVVGEMIAGDSGIGHYLVLMQFAVRAPEMYAAILVLAASGYALNRGFIAIERKLLFWYSAAAREGR
ncbi:MAG: ABC transporter permease [Acetobacteraceae bacterium]|nr:ABC transporter permease [Acetobacteraceae bacterium]